MHFKTKWCMPWPKWHPEGGTLFNTNTWPHLKKDFPWRYHLTSGLKVMKRKLHIFCIWTTIISGSSLNSLCRWTILWCPMVSSNSFPYLLCSYWRSVVRARHWSCGFRNSAKWRMRFLKDQNFLPPELRSSSAHNFKDLDSIILLPHETCS